jgi:integrase
MTVRKRGDVWYYDFQIKGVRYRGSVPEARLKSEAEVAEVEKRKEVFEGRYGRPRGAKRFDEFVGDPDAENGEFAEGTYLDWAKTNKKTWRHDKFRTKVLIEAFRGKTLREISPLLIEKFKRDRRKSTTKRNTERSPATVNRELELLSKIFALAIKYREIDSNPCREVEHFKEDNEQFRYLTWEEEPLLMAQLVGRRVDMKPKVIVAVGTGMRLTEQLSMRVRQVDFSRNLITAVHTKTGRNRQIPMSPEVRAALVPLCSGKRPNDFVFLNARTGDRIKEIKTAFRSACTDAGVEGLQWKHLRATFGTRLGEAGYNAFEIADLMGHSDIHTTRRYVRVMEGNKREAVKAAMFQQGRVVEMPTARRKKA